MLEGRNVVRCARLAASAVLLAAVVSSSTYVGPDAVGDRAAPPTPRVSAQRALELAVNEFLATGGRFEIRHPNHEARFGPAGVEFTARRGPDWRFTLAAVSVGDNPVPAVRLGRLSPERGAGRTVDYRRGQIIERYVARMQGIEQQFVIPDRLDGDGDLVIEGRIASTGDFAETDGGWAWLDEHGAVSLGDVTVIDATGELIAAGMEVTASSTRILVDGGQLARATYPVTVDPEIGTNDFRISDLGPDGDTNFDASSARVAYNSTNNEYLVIFTGDDNAGSLVDGESEVFGQRINAATGAEVGANDFRISDMGPDGDTAYIARSPAVAYNSTNNEYLVVWGGDDNTSPLVDNEYEMFGQRINAATGAEVGTNDFRISDMGPDGNTIFTVLRSGVAYNSTNNEYVVVWSADDDSAPLVDNDFEIFGQRVDGATGADVGANDFRISDMGPNGNTSFSAHRPDVVYNVTDNEYLVVWTGDDDAGQLVQWEDEIFGQRINAATGAEVGTNDFRISDMGPDGDTSYAANLATAGYNGVDDEYLVIWTGDDNTPPLVDEEREVFGQRIDAATGVELGINDFRISSMGPDGDTGFYGGNGSVAHNSANNEYLVVWAGSDDSGPLVEGEFEVFGQRLDATTGHAVGTSGFRISDMGPDGDTSFHAIYPRAAYNVTDNEYLAVWTSDDDKAPFVEGEVEVFGQRITGTPGEYVLDGFGVLHAGAGSPPPAAPTPYFGFDAARDVELATVGFYVLDGFGGVHAGDGASAVSPATPYFGFDAATDLELAPTGIYVLDGFGGVHAGGGAAAVVPPTPYFGDFVTFHIAQDLELAGTGVYVLDAFGGIHAGGGAPAVTSPTPYFGFDVARDIEFAGTGFFVLDGFGGVHAGGGATPMSPATPYFGFDAAEDLELASTGFYVLDAFGGVHAGGGAPGMGSPTPYFGFDVARDIELQ